MVTLCVLPNFKGSKSEWVKATISCLLVDSIYLVPMFSTLIK